MQKEDGAVPTWLVALRHIVGLALILFILNKDMYAGVGFSSMRMSWAVATLFVILLAVVFLGFWWLFFTTKARGHIVANYIRLQWALAGLLLLGWWGDVMRALVFETPVGRVIGTLGAVLGGVALAAFLANKYSARVSAGKKR